MQKSSSPFPTGGTQDPEREARESDSSWSFSAALWSPASPGSAPGPGSAGPGARTGPGARSGTPFLGWPGRAPRHAAGTKEVKGGGAPGRTSTGPPNPAGKFQLPAGEFQLQKGEVPTSFGEVCTLAGEVPTSRGGVPTSPRGGSYSRGGKFQLLRG